MIFCGYTKCVCIASRFGKNSAAFTEGVYLSMGENAKVAVITGASRGIGKHLALALAEQGYAVGLLARNAADLQTMQQAIVVKGGRAAYAVCDVAKREQVHAALMKVQDQLGPADLLIANAGISRPFSAKHFDTDVAREVWDINVNGLLYTIEPVLKAMLQRGSGHIVGISSMASYIPIPGHGAYCAAKAGVSTHLAALRGEVARKGITVTTVCPGYVRTDMTSTNEFSMPFLMDVERATDIVMRGIAQRKSVINFPWQMYLLIRIARLIPEWLRYRLMPKRK
jgi:short-subunit dehydrogenase